MKVSLNWAQEFSNVPLGDVGVDKLVEKIGAQLGAVEEVMHYGPRYDGIIVAKIVACQKHGDADKLSVCKIDDGGVTHGVERDSNGHIQVVCGAPNAREGLLVAWLPPGATVPSSLEKEPFVLESRVIRGQLSNGMLASPHELGISDNHEGILEIDPKDSKPGQKFKELYGLDDVIIDIENKMFTHRPDCFGVLGVAREIAGIQGKHFKSPEWYSHPISNNFQGPSLEIKVDEPLLVPRFMAVAMQDVKVTASPIWLQAGLTRVGLKPINNVVDITNYMMYVTGQPIHAYDADKLPLKGNLGARLSRKGEKVNLLNGKELEFQDDSTVVIVSGDTVVGIGGVMGGKPTEVSADTKNIIIECASFDMYNIRRTSMKYGLFTDAVTRFTKGQSVLQNPAVLNKTIAMMSEIAGGVQTSIITDVNNANDKLANVQIGADFVNERLGSALTLQKIAELLGNVEFDIVVEDKLHIVPPFWRTDIEITEDIVEEVGRLYGYDNLPQSLPARPSKPATKNPMLELKTQLRNILSSAGANEAITYSFVHGKLFEKVGQNSEHAFQLSNALSPDLQYYRMSLVPSLLEKVHPNVKAGHDEFALFEISKVHSKAYPASGDLPTEIDVLATVYSSDSKTEQPAFYSARKRIDFIANQLGVEFSFVPLEKQGDTPAHDVYDHARSARIVTSSGETVGLIGEFSASTQKSLKLPDATAGFEISLTDLIKNLGTTASYTKLSKFPSVQQDISLRVPASTSYKAVYDLLAEQLLNKPKNVARLSPVDIFMREEDKEHLQMTFRLEIAHYEKTLKSEEVNAMLDSAARIAKDKLGAERL